MSANVLPENCMTATEASRVTLIYARIALDYSLL